MKPTPTPLSQYFATIGRKGGLAKGKGSKGFNREQAQAAARVRWDKQRERLLKITTHGKF